MEAALPRDQFVARPKIEVVGVAENDFGAHVFQMLGRERLDGPLGADRHERRGLDHAVRGREVAAAR